MAWSRPSRRPQRAARSSAAAASCSGAVTSISSTSGGSGSLRAVRRVSDRPRPAPDSTISAPSSWASRATAKAREASVRTPVIRMRLPSRSPTAPDHRVRPECRSPDAVCKGMAVHVGILGGTARRRGLALRLAAAGVAGHASARATRNGRQRWPARSGRAGRPAACHVGAPPTRPPPQRRRGGRGHPVGSGRAHRESPRRAPGGKVVISVANALVKEGREMLALIPPRGSVAAAVQAALPRTPWSSAAFHHLPARDLEDLDRALAPTCSCAPTTPRPPRPPSALIEPIAGCGPSTPAAWPRPRPSRPSPPCSSP